MPSLEKKAKRSIAVLGFLGPMAADAHCRMLNEQEERESDYFRAGTYSVESYRDLQGKRRWQITAERK